MDIFSERLKWVRENAGLSQKELAEKIGMSPQGYGKIENGQREPNLETLAKLPYLLKESTDFLLGVTEIDVYSNKMISEFKNVLKIINQSRNKVERFSLEKANTTEMLHVDIVQRQIATEEEILSYFSNIYDVMRVDLVNQLKKVPGNELIAEEIVDDIVIQQRLEFNLKYIE